MFPASTYPNENIGEDQQMKDSLRTGISFGLTSAVITTLGLMVGLHSGTHSKIVGEHLMIAIVVIGITHWVGDWIGKLNS